VMGQETVTGGWNDKSSKAGNLLTKAFVVMLRKNRLEFGSVYQQEQQERVQPCHLSSSIYYGGPDVYFQPQSQNSAGQLAAQKEERKREAKMIPEVLQREKR
ncbi:hypothetical protein HID58_092013, partial [Brassica napus]